MKIWVLLREKQAAYMWKVEGTWLYEWWRYPKSVHTGRQNTRGEIYAFRRA